MLRTAVASHPVAKAVLPAGSRRRAVAAGAAKRLWPFRSPELLFPASGLSVDTVAAVAVAQRARSCWPGHGRCWSACHPEGRLKGRDREPGRCIGRAGTRPAALRSRPPVADLACRNRARLDGCSVAGHVSGGAGTGRDGVPHPVQSPGTGNGVLRTPGTRRAAAGCSYHVADPRGCPDPGLSDCCLGDWAVPRLLALAAATRGPCGAARRAPVRYHLGGRFLRQ